MNSTHDRREDNASTETNENELQKQIEQLALEKQPERDLWKGIEQALEQTKHTDSDMRSRKPILAMAASFMLVAIVGWMSFESGKSLQGESLVAALAEQHDANKKALLLRVKDQQAATNNWQQQIDELDEAAQAIKKALQEEPNNPALLKMLKNVYEQQMAIIERVHEPRWNRV